MEAGDFLIVPLLFARCVGHEEVDGGANGAAVSGFEIPKIDAHFITESRQPAQGIKTHIAVAPGFGARQFQRLAPVGLDLHGDAAGLHALQRVHGLRAVAEEERHRGDLHVVPVAVIVFGRVFIHAILAGAHPVQILREPIVETFVVGRGPCG